MDNPADWIVPIIVALLGGGGIWALFKIRPEAGMVVVKAAESVVIMQEGRIESLLKEIDECKRKADSACDAVERMEDELARTRRERDEVALENDKLKSEVRRLENRVAELERHTPPGGNPPFFQDKPR